MPKHVHIHIHGGSVRQVTGDAGFNESDHKRDGDGKFTSGGGGKAAASTPAKAQPNTGKGATGPELRAALAQMQQRAKGLKGDQLDDLAADMRMVERRIDDLEDAKRAPTKKPDNDDDELVSVQMAGHGPEKLHAIPKPPPGVPGGPQPGRGPVDLGTQRSGKSVQVETKKMPTKSVRGYTATAELSQFGGYRAKALGDEGQTSFLSSASFDTPEQAMAYAEFVALDPRAMSGSRVPDPRGFAGYQARTTAPAKPFDHGELNIPGRTNNINAQLDAYKKQQEAQRKATAKSSSAQLKEDKATAKAMLAEHTDAIVQRHGAKFGEKELRNILDQWAKWEPKKAIAFVNKFLAEQAK